MASKGLYSWRRSFWGLIKFPAFLVAAWCFIAAVEIPGRQALDWLRTAEWNPAPISRYVVLDESSKWAGAHLILEWLFGVHVSVGLFLIGLLAVVVCLWVKGREDELDLEEISDRRGAEHD